MDSGHDSLVSVARPTQARSDRNLEPRIDGVHFRRLVSSFRISHVSSKVPIQAMP
jgi:hypothetical protein